MTWLGGVAFNPVVEPQLFPMWFWFFSISTTSAGGGLHAETPRPSPESEVFKNLQ
jgi:hypothetical protein